MRIFNRIKAGRGDPPLADPSQDLSQDPALDSEPNFARLSDDVASPTIEEPPREREAGLKDYIRVFTYAKRQDIIFLVAAALSSIAAGVTMPLMVAVFGQLVENFSSFDAPDGKTQGAFDDTTNKGSLYITGLFIARLGLNYINKFCFRIIGIRISAAIRLHYMQCLLGQTIHVLDSMPPGAAATTITATSNILQIGVSEKLGTFLEYTATIISAIIIAFVYSWSVTLVTSSVLIFILLVLGILLPIILKGHARLTAAETKAGAVAAEALGSVRMITSCGAENRIARKYAGLVEQARQAGVWTSPFVAIQTGLVFFSFQVAFALAFWFGSREYSNGRIDTVGTVVIVLMSVMLMVSSISQVSTPLIVISKAIVAASEFFAVIDAPRPVAGTLRHPSVNPGTDIVFNDVHFAYPSRPSKKVLDGLNLRIVANKNTAIVGPSGSGKSTIVGLIEGWYTLQRQHIIAKTVQKKPPVKKAQDGEENTAEPPSAAAGTEPSVEMDDLGPPVELSGSITIDGKNMTDLDMKWWRSQVGLVQQEPFLFNDTIYNNVASGLTGTQWADEPEAKKRQLVQEACKESFADEFIDRLPEGYNTQVGDSGIKLSGGQRQRIAIARSIIANPKILILDEATSAIDIRSERIVQAALERVSRGRTTVTIAHRLSTIKNADQIIVLRQGKVAEAGTHESLLANPEGAYYRLVHAQKLSLGDDDGAEGLLGTKEEKVSIEEQHTKTASTSVADLPSDSNHDAQWKDKNILNGFGKLLYEQRSRFPLYVMAIIFSIGAAAAIPLQAYFFGNVISIFGETGQELRDDSSFWASVWVGLAVGVGICYFVVIMVATNVEHFIASVYRREYFDSMLMQKTSYFDQDGNSTGQLTARLSSDPTSLKELLGINTCMVLVGIFSLLGAIIISFIYGWKLALVALCVILPLTCLGTFYKLRYELRFAAMNEAVFSESSKFGAEAVGAFRTVTALVLEDAICERYQKLLQSHLTSAYRKSPWPTFIFAFSDSVGLACQALILWYGGGLVSSGEYNIIAFFITYMAVIQGGESAGQWLGFGPNAAQATAAANRILNLRNTRHQDMAFGSRPVVPETQNGIKIQFQDVHFKYPTRDVPIFQGINLTIEEGQFAAIVGASGSGKTSIVSLLERFYDVTKGRILFNGQDISDTSIPEHRRLLSLVSQEPALFSGTMRENILLGVDPDQVTDARLEQCCRDADIYDFICSLPDGFQTEVGNKGVSLSGGQKQRMSIARALIRNPRVLLLDEATSSLDSESEKQVQASLSRVAQGRTTIAVAHRLATIQNADVIYVLGEGKVLEQGSHSELLRLRGAYWSMCQSQALDQ
ncbi:P-loop containing nucleoside triphosphate hydrolase protein [Apodospora peruviana]|uniref:P-loop containing nucleoside triphosphate hydrolase protein n=1 Tax=Apodospora peruviana TaxID=516989 RepID=A0AAE0HSG2_9PEZI|nr:P-loop containing nucleoside triphosphate hydrolase protein [Apodospora peruviana]